MISSKRFEQILFFVVLCVFIFYSYSNSSHYFLNLAVIKSNQNCITYALHHCLLIHRASTWFPFFYRVQTKVTIIWWFPVFSFFLAPSLPEKSWPSPTVSLCFVSQYRLILLGFMLSLASFSPHSGRDLSCPLIKPKLR